MDGAHVIVDCAPAWLEELERNAQGQTLRTIVHTAGTDWEKLAVVDFPRRRVISGLASSGPHVYKQLSFDPMGCELSLPPIWFAHEDGKGSVNRLMSRTHRIGETISLMKTPLGLFIEASIDETPGGRFAWELMCRGQAKALSINAAALEIASLVDSIRFVSHWRLNEVSVCRCGADPAAKFHIIRDENGVVWP
jgi:hypothetical protein